MEPVMRGKTSTRKIQKSILVFVTGAFIVSGILIGLVSSVPLYNQMKSHNSRQLMSLVSSEKAAIKEFLGRGKEAALQVTSRSVIRERLESYYAEKLDLAELSEFTQTKLLDAMRRSPVIVGITRLDKHGKPFAHVGESTPENLWVVPGADCLDAVIGRTCVVDGKVRLVIGAPVLSGAKESLGVDVVLIDLSGLKSVIEGSSSSSRSESVFLGTDDKNHPALIFGPSDDRESKPLTTINDPLIRTAMTLANGGSGMLDGPGDSSYVAGYTHIPEANWGVVVRINKNEFYGPIWNQLLLVGLFITVTVILGAVGILVVMKPLTGKLILRAEDLEHEIQVKAAQLTEEITQRKLTEKDLEEKKQALSSLFDMSLDGILLHDSDGKIFMANEAAHLMFGVSEHDILGAHRERFVDMSDPKSSMAEEELRSASRFRGELAYRRIDGGTFPVEVSSSLFRLHDGEVRGSEIIRDITDRKATEAEREALRNQLLQAQKMEAVGTLTSGIAHDFNNLLTVINGYAELLLSERAEGDPSYHDIQNILETGRKGAELVQRLLAFGKKSEFNLSPLEVNSTVVNSASLLQRMFPKMIEIETLLAGDIVQVSGDAAHIQQALVNLCLNAKDAMPQGGKLRIETQNVTIDEAYCKQHAGTKRGRYVAIEVTDTGCGMPAETLDRIFDPFFTTKGWDCRKGTGLGLAVAKGVVEQHGGWITCDSQVGAGTRFIIYLPALESALECADREAGAAGANVSRAILLVDDEEYVRDLGKRILERAGYSVSAAPDGKTALDIFSKEGPNVAGVILDLMMPHMGGEKCLEELLKLDPNVKVIISTGHSLTSTDESRLGFMARGFISKPYRIDELLKAVEKLLANRA
jgi:PAS domain S-box-containing protein